MVIDKIALTLAVIGALNWAASAFSALTASPFYSAGRPVCSAA